MAYTLSVLARRVKDLDAEMADLLTRITILVKSIAPTLLDEFGVGADSAGRAADHSRRLGIWVQNHEGTRFLDPGAHRAAQPRCARA